MTPERRSKYILAVFVFVLVIGPMLMGGLRIVVDWIWFRQEGLGVLFTNVIKSQIELGGLTGVGFILIVGLNLVITQAIAHQPTHRVERDFVDLSAAERVNYAMRWVVWLAVLIVGYGLSHWGMAYWNEYLLAKNAMPMGTSDPVFGLDLSFFLFQLPFRWFLYYLAMVTAFGCLLSSVATYALTGGVWTTPRGPEVAPTVRTHLMMLVGVIMVILAYRMRLGCTTFCFPAAASSMARDIRTSKQRSRCSRGFSTWGCSPRCCSWWAPCGELSGPGFTASAGWPSSASSAALSIPRSCSIL